MREKPKSEQKTEVKSEEEVAADTQPGQNSEQPTVVCTVNQKPKARRSRSQLQNNTDQRSVAEETLPTPTTDDPKRTCQTADPGSRDESNHETYEEVRMDEEVQAESTNDTMAQEAQAESTNETMAQEEIPDSTANDQTRGVEDRENVRKSKGMRTKVIGWVNNV